MTVVVSEIRPGAYFDSIVLMRLQVGLAGLPRVLDAGVVMATDANKAILEASGLLADEVRDARADDLAVVVKAETAAAAEEALGKIDQLLETRAGAAAGYRPKSLAAAARQLPDARWVLVSVPGRFASRVAREALELGKNVFLYSDNVPVADEVALKRQARSKGLMVMGPDCGTARIGGVGFGFANRVRGGPVGLVAASGTGLQAVACRLHQLGAGVSHALGTGGRDLSGEVGGASARAALSLLARDPATEIIVLLSKPPAPEVARRLLGAAGAAGKPVVIHFLGHPLPARQLGNLHFAGSLAEAAELAAALAAVGPVVEPIAAVPAFAPGQRYLRALFAGGTLAAEALSACRALLGPVASNLGGEAPADPAKSRGHTVLDLGADEFTVGRLHPMIDPTLRLGRLAREAADPETAVILLDVVLGDGAHPDPAGALAPAIARARREAEAADRELAVVALVVGTEEDPQDLETQIEALEGAGARVATTVGEAVGHACRLLAPLGRPAPEDEGPEIPLEALEAPPAAINVGLESFHDSLLAQGARAVQVDWRPPAGGDEKLLAILEKLR